MTLIYADQELAFGFWLLASAAKTSKKRFPQDVARAGGNRTEIVEGGKNRRYRT
jgi:hypothetical protein